MDLATLLVTSFLWSAWCPLPDGDVWRVPHVIRGHSRALRIARGMDEKQVFRLLGEDGIVVHRQEFIGLKIVTRDYPKSGVAVSFWSSWEDRPQIPRVRVVQSKPTLRAIVALADYQPELVLKCVELWRPWE